ncbi:MAG: hypothetical protein AAGD34_01765 [Pseudomonadota bacterium]
MATFFKTFRVMTVLASENDRLLEADDNNANANDAAEPFDPGQAGVDLYLNALTQVADTGEGEFVDDILAEYYGLDGRMFSTTANAPTRERNAFIRDRMVCVL